MDLNRRVECLLEIRRVTDENRGEVIGYLSRDIVRHVFAYYDIQREPEHTITHIAKKDGQILGYILTYTATDYPSIVMEAAPEVAQTLITYAPDDKFIMHVPPELFLTVKQRFPHIAAYVENWMQTTRTTAKLPKSELVRPLKTEEDAKSLADLLLRRLDRPPSAMKRYIDWVSRLPTYGVFKNSRLVSYASSFIQLPEVWVVGGVFTDPEERNKGYATAATAAVTTEALNSSQKAILFVRSDNVPAIKAYEKIGYRKIGEKVWIDIGTGLKP